MTYLAFENITIQFIVLHDRSVMCQFRKLTGLNRSDLEVLVYAARNMLFTVYQVQKFYKQAQLQTVRRSVVKLTSANLIEHIGRGKVNKAKVYTLSPLGIEYLDVYYELWRSSE